MVPRHWYRAAAVRNLAPKVAQAIITALVTAVLTFLLVRLVPGDPVDAILGTSATPASEAALRHQLHLDQPLPSQFGSFMLDLVHGSFGQSLAQPGHSAWSLIAPALPVTLSVAGVGMALSVIVGVALGILSAVHRSRVLDVVIRVLAVISIATPPFLVALLLVLVRTIAMFELTFFTAGPDSQTLVVTLYYAVGAAGVRSNQSIDAMAVIYMVTTLVWLLIALRFVDPTQIVTRVKKEAAA